MKKSAAIWIIVLGLVLCLHPQEKQIRINVTLDHSPYNNLKMSDLQVTEGKQSIQVTSLHLIRGNQIIRQDGQSALKPNLGRHYIFIFSIRKYDAKIDRAIDYFFQHIIQPADSLALLTPEKSYRLKPESVLRRGKSRIANDLKALIRRDTLKGGQSYLSAIQDLSEIVREHTNGSTQMGIEQSLSRYNEILLGLESLRQAQQNHMFRFIERDQPNQKQKFLFLFYEREFKPDFNLRALQHIKLQYQERQEVVQLLGDLFEFFRRDVGVDLKQKSLNIMRSGITINAIFFRPKFIRTQDVYMKEYSEDMYSIFNRLSRVSGGILENTLDPLPAFEKTANNTNLYYLLSYRPGKGNKGIESLKVSTANPKLKFIHPQQVLTDG